MCESCSFSSRAVKRIVEPSVVDVWRADGWLCERSWLHSKPWASWAARWAEGLVSSSLFPPLLLSSPALSLLLAPLSLPSPFPPYRTRQWVYHVLSLYQAVHWEWGVLVAQGLQRTAPPWEVAVYSAETNPNFVNSLSVTAFLPAPAPRCFRPAQTSLPAQQALYKEQQESFLGCETQMPGFFLHQGCFARSFLLGNYSRPYRPSLWESCWKCRYFCTLLATPSSNWQGKRMSIW